MPAKERFKLDAPLPLAASVSVFLIAAKLCAYPTALIDAVSGRSAPEFRLEFPLAYLLTQPLSAFADMATLGSARQDRALVLWLLLGYWAWRLRRGKPAVSWIRLAAGYTAYLAIIIMILVWTVLAPRPAARLVASVPDDLIIDFHSHTNHSWDGRRSFSPQANIDWHRRAGFDAGFVTDHNTVSGSREAKEISRRAWTARQAGTPPFRSLEGEEVSLHDTHIVVLGNSRPIDNTLYNRGLDDVFRFLRNAPRFGGLAVMSLPEYWRHHPLDRWTKFADAGAAGFEIVNSTPKGLDFPDSERQEVAQLSLRRGLFLTGVSDTHGWGSTPAAWNAMRIPGHLSLDPDALQDAVLSALKRDPFHSVTVLVRAGPPPPLGAWIVFDPPYRAWSFARTFTWTQFFSCLFWTWALALLVRNRAGSGS